MPLCCRELQATCLPELAGHSPPLCRLCSSGRNHRPLPALPTELPDQPRWAARPCAPRGCARLAHRTVRSRRGAASRGPPLLAPFRLKSKSAPALPRLGPQARRRGVCLRAPPGRPARSGRLEESWTRPSLGRAAARERTHGLRCGHEGVRAACPWTPRRPGRQRARRRAAHNRRLPVLSMQAGAASRRRRRPWWRP